MESQFQFTNPALTNLEFKLNQDFDGREDKEVQIKMGISVEVSKHKSKNEAIVSLVIELGEKSKKTPFYVKAEETASFKWGADQEDEMVDSLLQQNAPALLLSYLRPVIVQITAASPYDAYNIPFINFTEQQEK